MNREYSLSPSSSSGAASPVAPVCDTGGSLTNAPSCAPTGCSSSDSSGKIGTVLVVVVVLDVEVEVEVAVA